MKRTFFKRITSLILCLSVMAFYTIIGFEKENRKTDYHLRSTTFAR